MSPDVKNVMAKHRWSSLDCFSTCSLLKFMVGLLRDGAANYISGGVKTVRFAIKIFLGNLKLIRLRTFGFWQISELMTWINGSPRAGALASRPLVRYVKTRRPLTRRAQKGGQAPSFTSVRLVPRRVHSLNFIIAHEFV